MIVPLILLFLLPLPEVLLGIILLKAIKIYILSFNEFIKGYGKFIACAIFVIAASTDGLDGYIARKRKQVTRLGKFLDPIADKLLVTAALIALVQRNEVTAWAATIIISREFIVTGLRMIASSDGIVISASSWGKIKTITQMIAIIATLTREITIHIFWYFPIDKITMFIAVLVTIYSGYDYIVKNIHIINSEKQ
jgi:CDP-diacylglycerol--glycerol-3-phosphate 3-phosphatidyltransferase